MHDLVGESEASFCVSWWATSAQNRGFRPLLRFCRKSEHEELATLATCWIIRNHEGLRKYRPKFELDTCVVFGGFGQVCVLESSRPCLPSLSLVSNKDLEVIKIESWLWFHARAFVSCRVMDKRYNPHLSWFNKGHQVAHPIQTKMYCGIVLWHYFTNSQRIPKNTPSSH